MLNLVMPYIFVDTETAWQRCLEELTQLSQFAIDIEADGMYAYREKICLIQISTRTNDYIIDPFAPLDWKRFGELIADPTIEKVLHASEFDLILMKRQMNWDLFNLFDTMWAVRILGHEKVGLANILETFYGVKLDKQLQRTNWAERPLSAEKLSYAQADTHYLLQLRDDLYKELERKGYLEESAEIFAEQARVRLPNTDFDPESFWEIDGVQKLPPRNRAVLRALNIYRDSEAKKLNRPPFKVFGNHQLFQIAQMTPRNFQQLGKIAGCSDYILNRYGAALLEIIDTALKSGTVPRQLQPSRYPAEVVQRYERLSRWRKEYATHRGVPSDVILSRDSMWEIAQINPKQESDLDQATTLGRWRRAMYGVEIVSLFR